MDNSAPDPRRRGQNSLSLSHRHLRAAIDRVVHLNEDISVASDEQMRGLDQINGTMSPLDDVTQRNAALLEEATAAAETLEELADHPCYMLMAFRLNSRMSESGKWQEGRRGTPSDSNYSCVPEELR